MFLALLEQLACDELVTVVAASTELFERGCSLYGDRLDKSWTLTDCMSFVVMRDFGIAAALTGDRHFQQAGFTALLS